jgi:hypothetical protein
MQYARLKYSCGPFMLATPFRIPESDEN